jgi:hypothetical protein
MRVEPGEARGRVSGGGAALTNESSVSCWAGEKDERIANMSREGASVLGKNRVPGNSVRFSPKKTIANSFARKKICVFSTRVGNCLLN